MGRQRQQILTHLRNPKNRGITSMDAFHEYGITRLAAIVHILRRDGYNIESEYEYGENRYGDECKYVRYWLHE